MHNNSYGKFKNDFRIGVLFKHNSVTGRTVERNVLLAKYRH